jgi:hypothetical protein
LDVLAQNEPKRYVAAGLISAMFSSSALPHAKELVEKLLPTNCTKFLCETVMIGGSATAHREGKGVSLELEVRLFISSFLSLSDFRYHFC